MRATGRPTETNPDEVFDLLGDEYVRDILVATSREALSAKELSDRCGMSVSTVYRRAETLTSHGLLVERTHIDRDGHHHSEFEAAIDHLDVDLDADGFNIALRQKEDVVDRFTRVWEGIRRD
ncbi:ArsR/SmtB family transcription factor [Halorarius litoreus]|uniref:ArsR/SmtB family transcription factor n=1 Tax=Halorarius litoreus TaxID=2962676 RepID=UPI0020CE9373|nr:helix-turn-helix domain-containing protein [Halorarius litoreus]